MTLRVRTLGALELDLDGVELPSPAGRPGRTLLAWLALYPGTHARSSVAAALWPDALDTSARASLGRHFRRFAARSARPQARSAPTASGSS